MDKKIIYIAGYGRSGSTILEMVLAQRFEVFPTGELTNLFSFYKNNNYCECGKRMQDCSFWNQIISEKTFRYDLKSLDKITKHAEAAVTGRLFQKKWEKHWVNIFNSIFQEIESDFIIDSSKSTRSNFNRVNYLQKYNFTVKELFLLRKPGAVMKSSKKGSNKRIEAGQADIVKLGGAIRAGLSWFLTNYFTFNSINKKDGLIITYEELVDNPSNTLRLIQNKFGLKEKNGPKKHHGVSGNRLRRKTEEIKVKKSTSNIELNYPEQLLAELLYEYYKYIVSKK